MRFFHKPAIFIQVLVLTSSLLLPWYLCSTIAVHMKCCLCYVAYMRELWLVVCTDFIVTSILSFSWGICFLKTVLAEWYRCLDCWNLYQMLHKCHTDSLIVVALRSLLFRHLCKQCVYAFKHSLSQFQVILIPILKLCKFNQIYLMENGSLRKLTF